VRQHVRPANVVTSLSICAGFLALVATSSQLALATALVLLAALLDVVDGALARRAGGDRTFGAQLDSLADLLCFCVVPALALHHASSSQLPVQVSWPAPAWSWPAHGGCPASRWCRSRGTSSGCRHPPPV
jgi:phosphatidylserine synthase